MPLTSGTKLGPYEIQSPLGAGGMGEVYRARDTRLDRIVAIKVLASHLSSSPELKQRMEREARAISSLNHANICHLYDIGAQDGANFLVMEFLEGETLAERLRKGALPLNEILRIGIAVAEALAVAHRQGIVHRDLKPANIMLTKGGVKLMDFGLAKSAAAGVTGTSSAPLLSAARTMSEASPMSPLTTAGAIIGTIQYMSPEQIEGREADARSDLFALGAVLYEMATGARPFEGKSQISVASAILEKDPAPISAVQPLTPPAFEHVITACLAKNPDDRFQTAQDVALQLKWIAQTPIQPLRSVEKKQKTREPFAWAVAAVLALSLIAVLLWWRASKPAVQATYYSAPLPFAARSVAVSPNGHTVAVVGHPESERNDSIWMYEPGSPDTTKLADTDGASFPFWSADGQSLAFFQAGKLKKLNLAGGPVQTLCDAPSGRGGTWNKDGVILFTPNGTLGVGLYQVPASGGTPTPVTIPDQKLNEDSNRWPVFLPDGIHYLYSAINLSGHQGTRYSLYVGALNSQEKRLIVKVRGNAAYATPGYLIFYRDQTLFAQRFDPKKYELTGEPTPILNDVQYFSRISDAVFAATSADLLVAQKNADSGDSQMLWFDRKGQQVGVGLAPGLYGNITLSPNGKFVASDTTDPASQNTDIWTYDLENRSARRLTFDPALDSLPVWSPDGNRIIFSSNRGVRFDLYLKDSNGAQEEKLIPQDGPDRHPTDWSRDGKYVLYERGQELWYLTFPDLHPTEFLKDSASLKAPQFSPDGKWVAYSSNESGRWEIYVTSFPDAHGKWQVSNAGGEQPRWRADGKELFYLSSDFKIMAVPVKTGANFDPGTPAALFQATPRLMLATSEVFGYAVSPDGQRFLVNTQLKAAVAPMSVVLNWSSKLNK